jgi:hypothetical protein
MGFCGGGASLASVGLGSAPGDRDCGADEGIGMGGGTSVEGLGAGSADLGEVGSGGSVSSPDEASSDGGWGGIGPICGSAGVLGGLAGAILGGALTGAIPLTA